MPSPIADPTDRQHKQHFHEYADNRWQRRSEFGTEQSNDRYRHQFERVAGPDQLNEPGTAIAWGTRNRCMNP